ncbi:uncharacterized protein VTP21DRAFT_5644 [Calcarisporiella thermophila]|uniref:uncharacterized protein n=1 Tax=Calcarisporiella thermophila TaxID=911321 RepID=UPI00374397E5
MNIKHILLDEVNEISSQLLEVEELLVKFNPAPSSDLDPSAREGIVTPTDSPPASKPSSTKIVKARNAKRTQGEAISPCLVQFGYDLRFQLRLNSLSDLHRLLSAHLVMEGVTPPEFASIYQQHTYTEGDSGDFRCSLMKIPNPSPFTSKIFNPPVKPEILSRRLETYLFHVYISDCCSLMQHPDRAAFLESYYREEMEPALLHTAVAISALHLLFMHRKTPVSNQLRRVVGELLERARLSLQDVFDMPSPQIVLAYLNMECCMRVLMREDDAYAFHTLAALMALALKMDREDPSEGDPIQREFQRRIWCFLCKMELIHVFVGGKPSLIDFDTLRNSPKGTPHSGDSEVYKSFLRNFTMEAQSFTQLAKFVDINFELPDIAITQHLISTAAFLQRDQLISMQSNNRSSMSRVHVGFRFWLRWCNMWQQFLRADIASNRHDTEILQQLRHKALEEYVKGLMHSTLLLQKAIRKQDWCTCSHAVLHYYMVFEMHKFIVRVHPNRSVRRKCFRELMITLRLLLTLESKGTMEHWLICHTAETLEANKLLVFTKEELEAMRLSEFKPLAVRREGNPL